MAAQAVAVAMIVVMGVIVAVAMAVVRMAGRFLGFLVHRLDSNRDLLRLTVWNLGSSMVNNSAGCDDRRARTLRAKRN